MIWLGKGSDSSSPGGARGPRGGRGRKEPREEAASWSSRGIKRRILGNKPALRWS